MPTLISARLAPTLVAVLLCWGPVSAQIQPPSPPSPLQPSAPIAPADPAARLTTVLTVSSDVSVEATLLPPNVTRGVFGKAVADRYAAVEVIISNRSRDSALIVHSMFIDYSQWLFSGTSSLRPPFCPPARADGGDARQTEAARTLPECVNPPEAWQTTTRPSQIAAAEYRIPRGTLLDAEPWSLRNWMIRIAETVGSVASGYVFTLKEANAAKAIAAYNGNFLPALRSLVPDSAIDQANRLSDLGFRVNKVIPKESSDILVAFFPIDRFLTPGIKKLYLESPALFFVPQSVLFDAKARRVLTEAAGDLGVNMADISALQKKLIAGDPAAQSDPILKLLDRLSLNNIRLMVGGTMNVDVDAVPASIERIAFDEADPSLLWAEPGQKTGTIHGRYLAGGRVTIVGADALQITGVSAVQEGSTDNTLRFQFTTNKAIVSGTKLTFRVDKSDNAERSVEGIPFDHIVNVTAVAPAVEKVERTGDTLTIVGQRFFSTDLTPLVVTLQPGAVAGVEAKTAKTVDRKPRELKIDLAPLALPPACWTPQVTVGTMTALGATAFPQPPVPKITAARRNGTRIVVTGEQFFDLASCGKPLRFEIATQAVGAAFSAVTQPVIVSPKEATFDLPATPADGKFKVRVLVGGVEADTRNVE